MEDYKKKYEEALGRANAKIEAYNHLGNASVVKSICEIFPEFQMILSESENEKIRESLLKYLKESFNFDGEIIYPEVANWIAWLEKQTIDISSFPEEQRKYMEKYVNLDKTTLVKLLAERDENIDESLKASTCGECEHPTLNYGNFPCDKVKLKFNIGDWIASDKAHEDWRVCKVINIIRDDRCIIESIYGNTGYLIHKDTSSYHTWTIQDAKDGDVLVVGDEDGEGVAICGKDDTIGNNNLYCVYDDENGFNINVKIAKECLLHPATKEQRDLLLEKIVDAGYIWDPEKKVLTKLEQNTACSEKYIADIFEKVGLAKIVREKGSDELTCAVQDAMIELSKFIPQQNTAWSEEDEDIRDKIIRNYKRLCGDINIRPVYKEEIDWLKSLKERIQPQPKQDWNNDDDLIYQHCLTILHDYGYDNWLKERIKGE